MILLQNSCSFPGLSKMTLLKIHVTPLNFNKWHYLKIHVTSLYFTDEAYLVHRYWSNCRAGENSRCNGNSSCDTFCPKKIMTNNIFWRFLQIFFLQQEKSYKKLEQKKLNVGSGGTWTQTPFKRRSWSTWVVKALKGFAKK